MAIIGNTVTSVPFIADSFSGNASTTSFSPLTRAPAGTASIAVFIAGTYQAPGSYTLSGTTITFTSPPASGVGNIIVLHLGTGSATQVTSDGSVTLTKLSSDTFSYINTAFTAANTPSYTANSAGSYANAAFATANTGTASGSYANSAFSTANTASTNATNAGTYANSAFSTANTASTNATNAGGYANSAFAKSNTSLTVTAGTGMSGGGAVGLGGSVTLTNAGVTSIVAGSGISISGATGAVTVTASGGGVTSLNGQTGAVTTTNFDGIGSCAILVSAQTSDTAVGGTIAGSSLRYNLSTINQAAGTITFGYIASGGNSYGGGGTAVSGTWRKTSGATNWRQVDIGCGQFNYYFNSALWIRIS